MPKTIAIKIFYKIMDDKIMRVWKTSRGWFSEAKS